MGKRLGSWNDLGGSSGGVEFAKKWQDEGYYKAILHKEPPWERRVHNFRRVEVREDAPGGPKKMILWYPYVCWEDDDYHRERRKAQKEGRTPPTAKFCPACRFIEHLEERDDLADDEVVFKFVAGRERRELLKVDVLGLGETRRAFQDNLVAKTEYIIPHIPVDDPTGILVTAEKWSMGKAIRKRIRDDIKIYGTDEDPSKKPIPYIFEYDKETQKYGCSRLDNYEIPESARELWAGPCPDASRFVAPGNPQTLYDQMAGAADVAGLKYPLDSIFGPALEQFKRSEEDDPALVFPPEADEGEKVEEKAEKPKKETKSKPKKETKSKPKKEKAEEAEEAEAKPNGKAKSNGAAEKAEEKPKRKTRKTKKKEEEPPPPPEPEAEVFECPDCGADWPEDVPKCPGCGAEADEGEGGEDGSQTASQAAQGEAKKGIPW